MKRTKVLGLAFLCLLTGAFDSLRAQTVSFIARQDFAAGGRPQSVAVGDFNGDGVPDLAVANFGSFPSDPGKVSMLLGNGDGSFQAARNFGVGLGPYSVAVGDLNSDGVPDLAVANSGSDNVSVLLGDGDESFQAARNFGVGRNPRSVAVGDFNGDGLLDLAVANSGSNNVTVLLGNGDGGFYSAENFGASINPISVAVGDFNGDGVPDLAVANNNLSGTVLVLLGNGDGTFQAARSFAAGINPRSVAVGDFNGDGAPDLAVAYLGTPPSYLDGSVSVLLGDGDGSFQAARNFGAGSGPSSVAVGDFNGDGVLDLAVAYLGTAPSYLGGVSVLFGNGDGSFQAARNFDAGNYPQSVAVGDFNGDGVLDLAVAYEGTPPSFIVGGVSVLLGNRDGSFQAARSFAAGSYPISVAVGDFNDDGVPDLAVANAGGVSVLLGNGDGSFQGARNFAVGRSPRSVAVGDFNGDKVPDLAVASFFPPGPGNVSVLLGNGDGSFQAARSFAAGIDPISVAVGDFNGDGIDDLAVANYYYSGSVSVVSVLLGNGDGSFLAARSFATGSYPISVAVGDFNGDGVPDLAVANNLSDNVSVLLGNGDGDFQAARNFGAGRFPKSVAVGDFNGDRLLDLAVANASGVSVLLGNGDGSFQAARNFGAGRLPQSVAVGDFNGDGLPDLAVANDFSNNVSVLVGNGDGSFLAARNFGAGSYPRSVAVGDFNGDGLPDLAVANGGSNDASVLINNTPQPAGKEPLGSRMPSAYVTVIMKHQDLASANNGQKGGHKK